MHTKFFPCPRKFCSKNEGDASKEHIHMHILYPKKLSGKETTRNLVENSNDFSSLFFLCKLLVSSLCHQN